MFKIRWLLIQMLVVQILIVQLLEFFCSNNKCSKLGAQLFFGPKSKPGYEVAQLVGHPLFMKEDVSSNLCILSGFYDDKINVRKIVVKYRVHNKKMFLFKAKGWNNLLYNHPKPIKQPISDNRNSNNRPIHGFFLCKRRIPERKKRNNLNYKFSFSFSFSSVKQLKLKMS